MNPKKAAKIFKALSNENRYELFTKIKEGSQSEFETGCGCPLYDIINSLNIGAPTISHHLKELVNAELIITEKKGKFVICRVNQKTLEELRKIAQ